MESEADHLRQRLANYGPGPKPVHSLCALFCLVWFGLVFKVSFITTQFHPPSVAAFVPQRHSWLIKAETTGPTWTKISAILPQRKFANHAIDACLKSVDT